MKINLKGLKFNSLHWMHWCVLTFSLILTVYASTIAKKQADEKIRIKFEKQFSQIIELVQERMEKYEDALWGGVALLKTKKNNYIDVKTWSKYSKALNIDEKYPGINGIGVIFHVYPDNFKSYIAVQKKLRPDFKVYPKHSNPDLFPITYIEPVRSNYKAVGLDIAHEDNRYKAALKARDTGKVQITGPIELVQEENKTPGFLLYAPFYKGKPVKNQTPKKENFQGMVYAPFVVSKLMKGTLAKQKRNLAVRIVDNDVTLYDELNNKNNDYDKNPMFKKQKTIHMYGREWVFDIRSTKSFMSTYKSNTSLVILLGGISIDILLLFLFLSLTRSNKLAHKYANKMYKKAEEQRALAMSSSKFAALGEMAGGVAHEINNPLAIITTQAIYLRKLLMSGRTEDAISIINKIDSTVLRISKIVKSMRQLSRDGTNDKYEIVSVESIIEESLDLCNERFSNNGIKIIKTNIDPAVYINCQKIQISQVIINLLNNAFDAICDTKDPWIEIKLIEENNHVLLNITDSGEGISEDLHAKILSPFFTTKKAGHGTGLGLSISKTILEQHGGELKLDSLSKNTCFMIKIPAIEVDFKPQKVCV